MYVILSKESDILKGGDGSSRVKRVTVNDFSEAIEECHKYIVEFQVDEKLWSGGQVVEDGVKLATISVDGKLLKTGSVY